MNDAMPLGPDPPALFLCSCVARRICQELGAVISMGGPENRAILTSDFQPVSRHTLRRWKFVEFIASGFGDFKMQSLEHLGGKISVHKYF